MTARHGLLGGKVQVFQRPNSPFWQCSASVGGRQFRASTKQEGLSQAKDFAEDWYLELKGKNRWGGGLPQTKPKGPLFRDASAKFIAEFKILAGGERSAKYVDGLALKIKAHLDPFFGDKTFPEITDSLIQEYRLHRAKAVDKKGNPRPPARPTIHHEIITLRHILKTAKREGWLQHLPDLSAPYKASGKVSHRAWFSPDEYRKLRDATRKRAKHPLHAKWKWESEQFHDFVLFMANTGLRPDEAARLEFRDVSITGSVVVTDGVAVDNRILEIEVRGKRGVGYCKSMPGAVRPFERARDRERIVLEKKLAAPVERKGKSRGGGHGEAQKLAKPGPTDLIFGRTQRELVNTVLDELDLKFDRDGQRRTAYSLRHTYICFRLMEGADIYQIAKNCRTSVEMIEKFYASHLKNMLDAAAINVRRSKGSSGSAEGALTNEVD
jgi:integrase